MDTNHLQYSPTSQTILQGQTIPSEDTAIKKLFSNRHVVAWLLKQCTDEYRDVSLNDICEHYLPRADIKFNEIPVHTGDAPPTILLSETEDKELLEGTTVFDVLFKLPVPDKPDRAIGVLVNIEVQNKDNPGYEIVSRMIYYLTRMIAMERNEIFTKSNYNDICKVYSLWFMPSLSGNEESSILRYHIAEDCILGPADRRAPKVAYDLLEGLICRFSSDQYTSDNPLIHYLQLLLTNIDSPGKRLDELQLNYGIPKTQEAETMCNYTLVLINKGKELGYKVGKDEGKVEGREEGMKKGKIENQLKILRKLEAKHTDEISEIDILDISADELHTLKQLLYTGQFNFA